VALYVTHLFQQPRPQTNVIYKCTTYHHDRTHITSPGFKSRAHRTHTTVARAACDTTSTYRTGTAPRWGWRTRASERRRERERERGREGRSMWWDATTGRGAEQWRNYSCTFNTINDLILARVRSESHKNAPLIRFAMTVRLLVPTRAAMHGFSCDSALRSSVAVRWIA
jgi:hypothetical protein